MSDQEESPRTINVITLNCWGLKFLAKLRNERLSEIGRRIATADPVPEIVGLQECWTQEDYRSIRKQTRSILPYSKFYHSGTFGGGLAILSKWPIEESSMVRYPLNGRPTAFFRGDWFVGKGVACARIRIGPAANDVAEVFTTHLHAPYEREPNDSYICHRTAQAWEIAKLMRGAAEKGHLVIGLGDFNMIPLSLAHRLITTHAPVQDAWRVLHPDSSIGAWNDAVERGRGRPVPDASYNLKENGATCDSVMNTWRWSTQQQKALTKGRTITIEGHTQDPRAKRLDYIFVGNATRHPEVPDPYWQVQSVKVGMTDRHPALGCSLSDHFSVEATLSRSTTPPSFADLLSPETRVPPDIQEGAEKPAAVTINGNVMKQTPPLKPSQNLPASTYDEILVMIATYTLRERRQRHLRLSHFGASIIVSIGCLTAIWWSPRNFVSFILMLISTLGLGAGVIDGLIGGLFVGSEIRALKEFEWEIRNARRAAGHGFVSEDAEGFLQD
ncbi:phospholipase C type enzyme [Hypocenomyce scalaris]|nr:phospholipase C type enzyme [Hypocenomyce scalaris]